MKLTFLFFMSTIIVIRRYTHEWLELETPSGITLTYEKIKKLLINVRTYKKSKTGYSVNKEPDQQDVNERLK